ncbi:hypothetical protein GCM10025762_56970 [Haloechinothrix salitolerans]
MPEPVSFGGKVAQVVVAGGSQQRYALFDIDAVLVQRPDLLLVVRQQPHRPNPEVAEYPRRGTEVTDIHWQPKRGGGVDGVQPGAVLKRLRLHLGEQADATALVPAQIHHDSAARFSDHRQRGVQLLAALAP